MRDVSIPFKNQIATLRNYAYRVTIAFNDSDTLILHNEDLMIQGCEINVSPETSSFPLGCAIAKTLSLALTNVDDRFSLYDFYGASIHVVLTCYIYENERNEEVDLGTYTVIIPETPGSTIEVTAVDDMYKADMPFVSDSENITAGVLFDEVCRYCGLVPETTSFRNSDYIIKKVPDDMTCREVIGAIAMLAGGNAEILPLSNTVSTAQRNVVHIASYDFTILQNTFDGGDFIDFTKPQILDGGDFDFTNTDNIIEGGSFYELNTYHVFTQNNSLVYGTDTIVVTGVKITVDDVEYICGSEGYVIAIENKLLEDEPQNGVNRIGAIINGATIRTFELDYISNPLVDFADRCIIQDRKQRTYPSVVTDINFVFKGATKLKCTAEAPIRNDALYSSNTASAVQKARKQAVEMLTNYDLEAQRMNSLASMAMGYHQTNVEQEDGSRITYLHDKPELTNSTIIYKITVDGFFISQDGGQTYINGFDSQGNAVLNILSAIGINCDWIRAGTLTLGGNNNQDGTLKIKNNSGTEIGSWTKDGIVANAGYISGFGVYKLKTLDGVTGDYLAYKANGQAKNTFELFMRPDTRQGYIRIRGDSNKETFISGGDVSSYYVGAGAGGIISEGKINVYGGGFIICNQNNQYVFFTDGFRTGCAHISESNIYVNGSPVATNSSDERLKKHIRELDITVIRKFFDEVIFVQFNFIKAFREDDKSIHFGVTAQNIQQVLTDLGYTEIGMIEENPEITADDEPTLVVDYQELIALQGRAIQDLYAQVERLTARVTELEERLYEQN